MNGTLCKTTSLADELFHETTDTPAPQDLFATAPIKVMRLEFDWQREEEAYTSFEAAISNRVLALKGRHIGMKVEAGTQESGNVTSTRERFASMAVTTWYKVHSARVWQRGLLLVGAALLLLLAGFDLMGMLVLYVR